jgi:hypothetical protein
MRKFLLLVLSVSVVVAVSTTRAQAVADRVCLESQNPQGVPVHPAASDNSLCAGPMGPSARSSNGGLTDGETQQSSRERAHDEARADMAAHGRPLGGRIEQAGRPRPNPFI